MYSRISILSQPFFSEIFINIGWFSKRKTIRAYKNVIRVLFPERSGEKFSMYVSRMCVDCTLPCKEPDDQRHFLFGYSSSSESPVTALGKQRHSQACQHSGRHTRSHSPEHSVTSTTHANEEQVANKFPICLGAPAEVHLTWFSIYFDYFQKSFWSC